MPPGVCRWWGHSCPCRRCMPGGILWASAHNPTLPPDRRNVPGRWPPDATGGGAWSAVGAAQQAASAGAACEVPRWAGVTGFATIPV